MKNNIEGIKTNANKSATSTEFASLRNRNFIQNERYKKLIWPFATFILIIIINFFVVEDYVGIEIKNGRLFGSIIDIFNRGAPVLLLSIGMTLVFATGGVDLSVGSVMAIAGAVAAIIINPGYTEDINKIAELPPLAIVIIVPLIVAIIAGVWNGALVANIGIQPIIATLVLMVAGRGIAQLITKGQIIIFDYPEFQFIGSGFLFGLPFPIIIVAVVFIIIYLLSRKTALGIFIEAVGYNPEASSLMGIKTKYIKILVYGFCGLCAGIAGLIATADIKCADANNIGNMLELDAIASVIIGGTIWGGRFTLVGSVIGTLILQSATTTILTTGIPGQYNYTFKALIVIIVTLIHSEAFRNKVINRFLKKLSFGKMND